MIKNILKIKKNICTPWKHVKSPSIFYPTLLHYRGAINNYRIGINIIELISSIIIFKTDTGQVNGNFF